MRCHDRNDVSSFSQKQSARQTRYTSAGIELVICSYSQMIIAISAGNPPKHNDMLFILTSHDQ
jgi:hypothetical protein